MYRDNTSAIAQAEEQRAHQKEKKHVIRKYHLIRQFVKDGDIKVCMVHVDRNVLDPLTMTFLSPSLRSTLEQWS
jgi:hypothetical protein